MKYLSNLQIQEALVRLRPYNVFFSTTFLVMKKEGMPVGSMKQFRLDGANRDFLNQHYRIHPESRHFFRVMRQTRLDQDWSRPNFASTSLQSVNTQSFRNALLHEPNGSLWGWENNYVLHLQAKLPTRRGKLPLFHLAVWLYKFADWHDNASRTDIVDQIIRDYRLSEEELNGLFETSVYSEVAEEQVFQDQPVSWDELLAQYARPPDVAPENSGVLKYLQTEFVGPATKLTFEPGERLNLITGDNGLGKTFLLDLAWWALTGDWVDQRATPVGTPSAQRPTIKYLIEGTAAARPVTARYTSGNWVLDNRRPVRPGLAVYARVDGSFAVWDPLNRRLSQDVSDAWPGIKFTREEVWDGKRGQIEGLIRDLVSWQLRSDQNKIFETFRSVLTHLYAPDLGEVSIGDPVRIPNDPREIPTFLHPYGQVPILFESAGIRRIITLAYLLVWVWEEHKVNAQQQRQPEERQMVILLDEAEAHLHPKWQRVLLPGLLQIAQELHNGMSAQWVISTHSPLVLASVEGRWDAEADRLFHLVMSDTSNVSFEEREYERRGPIDSWLASDLFALRQPGSAERERAIRNAIRVQTEDKPAPSDVEEATKELQQYLSPEDPFWVRWIFFADSYGAIP